MGKNTKMIIVSQTVKYLGIMFPTFERSKVFYRNQQRGILKKVLKHFFDVPIFDVRCSRV